MSKSKIYLIGTGLVPSEIECQYNSSDRIKVESTLSEKIEEERSGLDSSITPGQMFNVKSLVRLRSGELCIAAGYVDYVEHVAHAMAGISDRSLLDSRFNAFCTESLDRTTDGLLIALRRDVTLPHGPGIYTGAGGYGVHFRGRDVDGRFVPLNRSNPFDVISFYVNRELGVPEDSFSLEWLGMAKCYDLSFDFPVDFLTRLSHSADDILRIRSDRSDGEGHVLDDMINFVQDDPLEIMKFLDLIGVEKGSLPKDGFGLQYGENPLTGKLGFNDDFLAVILQHMRVNHPSFYNCAVQILDDKGYEIVDVSLQSEAVLDVSEELLP